MALKERNWAKECSKQDWEHAFVDKLIEKPKLDFRNMNPGFSRDEANKILKQKRSGEITWQEFCNKMELLTWVNYDPEREYYKAMELKRARERNKTKRIEELEQKLNDDNIIVDPF